MKNEYLPVSQYAFWLKLKFYKHNIQNNKYERDKNLLRLKYIFEKKSAK